MKNSFFFKIFFAFISFSSLILGFVFVTFQNTYDNHNKEQQIEKIVSMLNHQTLMFDDYLKNYEQKLIYCAKSISSNPENRDLIDFDKSIFFYDKNILDFKITSLNGMEIFKIALQNGDKSLENKNFYNIFINSEFEVIKRLKEDEIYYLPTENDITLINLILRKNGNFYILEVNIKDFLNKLYDSFDKKTLIASDKMIFINFLKPNYNFFKKDDTLASLYPNEIADIKSKDLYKSEDFVTKRVYINENRYLIFFISNNYKNESDYLKEYFLTVLILVFILSLILAFIFSKPIVKLNKRVEEENKNLDLSVKRSYSQLNENQKTIDKHIMFIKMDKNRVILDVSQAFCYFLGFSKGELIGHTLDLIISKDENIDKLFETKKEALLFEIEGMKKDGEKFWIEIFVESHFESDMNLQGYTLICNDTTSGKKIEKLYEDINSQVEQYNAIFQNVNSGIALIDLEGNFLKTNIIFTKILGYSTEELLKMNCLDIVNHNSKEIMLKILEEAKELGNIKNIEKLFVKKDGMLVDLELSLGILSDKKHFVFMISSLEDKRELRELNQNLELRIQQEVDKSIQKDKLHQQEQIRNAKLTSIGSLSAGIAHEINTPLTYIKGNLELMEYDILDLPESQIKYRMKHDSEKMKEGINRIANIVESMREMSQSSREITEDVNVYATLITSLTMAHNRAKQISKIYLNGKVFDIDMLNKNEESFICKVQKQRLEQVWIIIINNALDELVKIENYDKRLFVINIYEEKGFVYVRFKDNAGGISPDVIDDIFEPFMSTKEHSGMGVGLNIAKKIVEEQGGEIVAFNEDNGAIFQVTLPTR